MILASQLQPIGTLTKTHGVDGELVAVFDIDDIDLALRGLRCVMLQIEGLYVPFFIASTRSRGAASRLLRFDGVDTQPAAAELAGLTIYALAAELPADDDEDADEAADGEGLYAEDLVGFTATDAALGTTLGTIEDVDLTTANALFVIAAADGRQLLVPIADEFIAAVDPDARTLALALPPGLLDL